MTRSPSHGRAVRDDEGIVIGWTWVARDGVHVVDDRHGIESVHPGERGQGVADLVCARRTRHPSHAAASIDTEILALGAESYRMDIEHRVMASLRPTASVTTRLNAIARRAVEITARLHQLDGEIARLRSVMPGGVASA